MSISPLVHLALYWWDWLIQLVFTDFCWFLLITWLGGRLETVGNWRLVEGSTPTSDRPVAYSHHHTNQSLPLLAIFDFLFLRNQINILQCWYFPCFNAASLIRIRIREIARFVARRQSCVPSDNNWHTSSQQLASCIYTKAFCKHSTIESKFEEPETRIFKD